MTSIEDILLDKINILSNELVDEQRKNLNRSKVVDLHTEIQDLKAESDRLNGVLYDRFQMIESFKYMCQSIGTERNRLNTVVLNLEDKLSAYEDRFTQDSKHISRRDRQVVEYVEAIEDLRAELSDRDRFIDDINKLVKGWKTHAGCFNTMQKVSNLLDEWMNEEKPVDDTPDVMVKIAFLELP